MIQSVLFFLLGFLSAGFLAVLIAPAIWRRAVALTRKRIEASAPLSLADIQADKDRLRAEFAMTTRRLEMKVNSAREKANAQLLEISKGEAERKTLVAEREEKELALSRIEAMSVALQSKLDEREGQVRLLSDKLDDAQRAFEARGGDLDRLGRLYEEASFAASSRQIELVGRENEIEKLNADLATARGARKEAEARYRDIASESRLAREALDAEKKRYADLEAKYQRVQSSLIEHEERLARRDQELARLRGKLKNGEPESPDLPDPSGTRPVAPIGEESAEPQQAAKPLTAEAKLSAERDRLVARLTALARERGDAGAAEKERALLREQIAELASRLVVLTALREGPDSLIAKALSAAPSNRDLPEGPRPTSLADRMRRLQDGAPS